MATAAGHGARRYRGLSSHLGARAPSQIRPPGVDLKAPPESPLSPAEASPPSDAPSPTETLTAPARPPSHPVQCLRANPREARRWPAPSEHRRRSHPAPAARSTPIPAPPEPGQRGPPRGSHLRAQSSGPSSGGECTVGVSRRPRRPDTQRRRRGRGLRGRIDARAKVARET